MARTANINIRTEPSVKTAVEKLYSNFGITLSDAVNIFLYQSLLSGGLPFEMKQPRYNAETEAAIEEARMIMAGKIKTKSYSSTEELFQELDSECCD